VPPHATSEKAKGIERRLVRMRLNMAQRLGSSICRFVRRGPGGATWGSPGVERFVIEAITYGRGMLPS
jgi:hypothetical protein